MESAAARWPRPPGRASTPGRGPGRSDSRVWSQCGVAGRGSESPVGATRPRVGDPAPSTPLQSPSILMRDRLKIDCGWRYRWRFVPPCLCLLAGSRSDSEDADKERWAPSSGDASEAPQGPTASRASSAGASSLLYRRQISRACSLPLGGTASPGSPPAQGEELRVSRISDKFNMYSLKARWPGDGHAGLEWGPPGISRAGGVAFHA